MNSYSQINQDIQVLNFYKCKRGGFFLDIGAWDGITSSNSALLEKEYDWSGICVEANPQDYNKLLKNRPKATNICKAVYNSTGEHLLFDVANNCTAYSSITQNIDKWRDVVDENKTTITVETITLNDLLMQNNAPKWIDYLSLDTEGSELEILMSVDHSVYAFGLIDVEHNFVEPKRTNLRNFLISHDYIYLGENNFDDRFCHKSVAH